MGTVWPDSSPRRREDAQGTMRKAAARDLGSRPLEGTALTNQGAQYPLIKEYALIVWFKANSVVKEYTLNYGGLNMMV